MGFWNSLFGKTVKIGDAFFGEMVFIEIPNNPVESYFECERYFKPSGAKIGLGVTGSVSGPTQWQKNFFTQIEKDYPFLLAKFIPVIEARVGAWLTAPVIQDFEAEFEPTYFSIPACDQQPVAWEITFDTVHDVNHMVTVGMLGYEPHYVRIDG
jgi:hypothetical protein